MKKFKTDGGHSLFLVEKEISAKYSMIVYGEFFNFKGAYGFWDKEGNAIELFGLEFDSLDSFKISNFFREDLDNIPYSDERGV